MKTQRDPAEIAKDAKRYQKSLMELTHAVQMFLERLDKVMEEPSTVERGHKVAQLSNALEFANDSARHFGLGIDLKTGRVKRPAKVKTVKVREEEIR